MREFLSKTTLIGFSAGLTIAVGGTVILWLNPEHAAELQAIMDLLAGFPVVLARRWEFSQSLCNFLFFSYWGLNGAAVARLIHRYLAAD